MRREIHHSSLFPQFLEFFAVHCNVEAEEQEFEFFPCNDTASSIIGVTEGAGHILIVLMDLVRQNPMHLLGGHFGQGVALVTAVHRYQPFVAFLEAVIEGDVMRAVVFCETK